MEGDVEVIDGLEYIITEIMPNQFRPVRLFTLTDGSKWTVKSLAASLSSTESCARARLKSSQDPLKVFCPIRKATKGVRDTINLNAMINPKKWWKDPLVKLMLKG